MYSKFEEIYPPFLKDFLKITNKYTENDFINMEAEILNLLDFKLTRVTHLDFYDLICKKLNIQNEAYNFGLFLIFLSYFEIELIKID